MFPTLNDIMSAPKFDKTKYCKPAGTIMALPNAVCLPLQGKSLAGAVLGDVWEQSAKAMRIRSKKTGKKQNKSYFGIKNRRVQEMNTTLNMVHTVSHRGGVIDRGVFSVESPQTTNSVRYKREFAISQSWRCSPHDIAVANKNQPITRSSGNVTDRPRRESQWVTCDKMLIEKNVLSIMGYSMRTKDFRYTAWYFYNQILALPIVDATPFEEEVRIALFIATIEYC